ncbi:hypothetical protein CPLU01_08377 [Colletotrichum plurivorum]|uniref:Uncharacterized protein n=1 Tax=Colletotrichum plurivorum TaxID=2175906 RepID=A0A8H6KCB2_9PEZI|nr:hypothetical protein CPLU01_08377 [Colletotrichum plurivorum]
MEPSLITTPATVTTQDATSTTTQPHAALTTPFIYPPHCSYALRSIEHHLLRSSTVTTTATLLVLDPSNPAVVACHPSGWNSGSENFALSGAVCPSGWDAHGMRRWGAFTTAHCCQRWYTLDVPEPWRLMPDNAACYRGRRPGGQRRGLDGYGPVEQHGRKKRDDDVPLESVKREQSSG